MNISEDKTNKGIGLVTERLSRDGNILLYLAISGSHAWGLSRPDSDIDLRGVYQKTTKTILGLHKGRDTVEFSEGDYDIQLYELEKFLNMLCAHNGNMVNLIWLPDRPFINAVLPWAWLGRVFLTKRLRHYYRGYAEAQRKRAMSCRGGKALIYTYREIFSGLYTLYHGKMEHDFMKLWDEAKLRGWYSGTLLDKYFPDPKQEVTDEGWRQFYSEWESLCLVLDKVAAESNLPDDFNGVQRCSELLLNVRLSNLLENYES